ncbi:MAG: hypothetical protein Q9219_002093 [cf. Caloplaca sp. 3 TL-2023]
MEQQPPSQPSGPGRTYIAINALFIVLVSALVGLRFWARRLKKTYYGWDDWWILAALIIFYGQASLNFWVVYHGGLGYHAPQAGRLGVRNTFLQLTISQFIYAIQFLTIRLSICFLFKRIFVQRWLQKTIWFAIAINIAWALFVVITALTVCKPIAYNWDLTIPGGHCNNQAKLNTYIANAVWTILYDSFLWSLPQFIVWRLHMRLSTKLALSTIFALGIFDIIVSIIRITYVTEVNFEDVTAEDYRAQVWTVVEISVAIILACLPLCRVVVQHFLPGHFLSHTLKQPMMHTKSWTLEVQDLDQDDKRVFGGGGGGCGDHHQEVGAADGSGGDKKNPFDEEEVGGGIELQVPAPAAVPAGRMECGVHQIAREDKAVMRVSDQAALV